MKFKLRSELIGIVLAFFTTGTIAASADASAYQAIYQQQDQQEEQIHKVLHSEFITKQDAILLEEGLLEIQQAESQATRRKLQGMLEETEQNLAAVQQRLVEKEANQATIEYQQLMPKIQELTKQSQQAFVTAIDEKNVSDLKVSFDELQGSHKVAPIRSLASDWESSADELSQNQQTLMDLSNELQELNDNSVRLSKLAYLSADDLSALEEDRKANEQFFKDADSIEKVTEQRTQSISLYDRLASKQKDSQEDFDNHQKSAETMVRSIDTLLSDGKLTEDETNQLQESRSTLQKSLKLEGYQPGDLAKQTADVQPQYEEHFENSQARIAQAKKVAEEKAAEEARQQAAQQQAAQQQAASPGSPQLVGEWYQAPAGFKFLKVESGLTYGQVKNPNNFSLISNAEASNYRAGHGNGSAKQ